MKNFIIMILTTLLLLSFTSYRCNAQLVSQLTQFVGASRFEALSLAQGNLVTCRRTRELLIEGEDSDNYFRLLRTVRADLKWLQAGAYLSGVSQATSVTGLIPPVDDGPVGAYVQTLLELGVEFFAPTNFFQMLVDLLRLLCDGIERDELRFDPNGRFSRVVRSVQKLVVQVNQKRGRASNIEYSTRGGFVYSRINAGAPYRVLQASVFVLNGLLRLGRKLGNIPLLPFRLVGRASQARLATKIVDDDCFMVLDVKPFSNIVLFPLVFCSQFSLRPPKEVLEFINERLEDTCDTQEGKTKKLVVVLNILGYLRTFISILGPSLTLGINSNDIPRLDQEYRLLLTDEILAQANCEVDLYDLPSRVDGLFALAEFYEAQIDLVDQLLDEFPDSRRRQLQGDQFVAEIQETEQEVQFLLRFVEALDSIEPAINNVIQTALDAVSVPYESVIQAILIQLPNIIEEFTNLVAPFTLTMEPVAEIFQAVIDVIPDPPSPFGQILSAISDIICEVVNAFGSLFGSDNLCDEIVELVGNFIQSALDSLNLPSTDYFDDLFDFSFIDTITDSLDLDFEFVLDLQSFLPADFLGDYGQFFDPEFIYENFEDFLTRFIVTPADVLATNLDPPSSLAALNIERRSAFVVDSTMIEFSCPTGTTPVTVNADFTTDSCRDVLVGQLRFPCDGATSSCTQDVTDLLFCEIPEPDEFFNTHLGQPVTRFSVTYYCFNDLENFKFLPFLSDGRTGVTLDREGDSAERSFDNELVNNLDYDDALPLFTDTYQRASYFVTDVTATPMDCSRGALDREIYLASIPTYIDPCTQGSNRKSYPYHSQLDSRTQRRTDACGYKVLFDEGDLPGCSRHSKQSFVGQKRLASSNRNSVTISSARGLQNSQICWEDPDDCLWVNPFGNTIQCEPRSNYQISWQDIANKLEQCEYFFRPSRTNGVTSVDTCPFRGYRGLKFFQGAEGDSEPQGYTFAGACDVFGGPKLYELPPPKNSRPFNHRFFRNADFVDQAGNPSVYANCNVRDRLEDDLIFANQMSFPASASYNNARSHARNIFSRWQSDLEANNARCFGDGTSPGAIEQCITDPSKICDLKAINCVPPEFDWACIQPSEDIRITRDFLFSNLQESKTISCPSQTVNVDGIATGVALELVIVTATQISNLIDTTDLTSEVLSYCLLGPGKTFCTFTPGSNVFPPSSNENRVLEIDSMCKCPAGFEREPNEADGQCQPCDEGFARPDDVTTCVICNAGSVSSSQGARSCTDCQPGFFQAEPGERECTPCAPGEFAASSKAEVCESCPAGSFQPQPGQSFCKPVDPGFYQPSNGAGSQLKCPPGTFSEANAIECTECQPGEFSRDGSANACEICPEGTYSIMTGASSCSLCPQGFYNSGSGATECIRCPLGLTTSTSGASDVGECGQPTNLELLANILKSGSSSDFNRLETVQLRDNGLQGRLAVVSEGCADLIMEYVDGATDENILSLLDEIGNGYCNRGPWNTEACGWDGGDCCPQTCETLQYEEQIDSDFSVEVALTSRRCFYLNFECRDPGALGVISTRCETFRRRDRRKLRGEDLTGRRASFLSKWSYRRKNSTFPVARRLQVETQQPGDGVCNPKLNNEENLFDGGDCCPSTCKFNPIFAAESCSPSSFFDLPVGLGCETGFGCCDPLVEAEVFSVTDIAPPIIKAVPDFRVECNAIDDSILNGPPPFAVTVTDNDPCFEWDGSSGFERVINTQDPALCSGEIQNIEFRFTAVDNAPTPNEGSLTVMAVVEDTLPPYFECPGRVDVSIIPGQVGIQLPLPVATDLCSGSIVPVYSSSIAGINIDSNGVVTGWEGEGTPLELNLVATDPCGNTSTCNVVVNIMTEMPSSMPSSEPSNMPVISEEPSAIPTLLPSTVPSVSPSSQPSTYPSNTPSVTPSLAPSSIPSIAPSLFPSSRPSTSPSSIPSLTPSVAPSPVPSIAPSVYPSATPTETLEVDLQAQPPVAARNQYLNDGRSNNYMSIYILSTEWFDASTVELGSLRAGKIDNVEPTFPNQILIDFNEDGLLDLRLQFRPSELGFTSADFDGKDSITIFLSGRINDGGGQIAGFVDLRIEGGGGDGNRGNGGNGKE